MFHKIINTLCKVKYTFLTLIIILSGSILFLLVFTSTVQYNPIRHKYNFDKQVLRFTPQGWAFFTRSAREEQIYIYKIDGNSLKKINQRHADLKNIIGLSRDISKIGIEIDALTNIVNIENFMNTEWNYEANLLGKIPEAFIEIKNPIYEPLLCGEYLLVFQPLVPWAWSKSKNNIKMPSKVIKLRIEC